MSIAGSMPDMLPLHDFFDVTIMALDSGRK